MRAGTAWHGSGRIGSKRQQSVQQWCVVGLLGIKTATSNQATECFLPLLLALACSEQFPLAEARLQGVGDQAAPASTAIKALQDLLQHIEAEKVGGDGLLVAGRSIGCW